MKEASASSNKNKQLIKQKKIGVSPKQSKASCLSFSISHCLFIVTVVAFPLSLFLSVSPFVSLNLCLHLCVSLYLAYSIYVDEYYESGETE